MKQEKFYGWTLLSPNRNTNRRVGCAKLRGPINHFRISSGEELWLTKTSARIHRARARHRKAESTAVHRAREPATQSNSIAIAVTQSVREISENLECAGHDGVLDLCVHSSSRDPKRRRALLAAALQITFGASR
jgi:hypothetical protein